MQPTNQVLRHIVTIGSFAALLFAYVLAGVPPPGDATPLAMLFAAGMLLTVGCCASSAGSCVTEIFQNLRSQPVAGRHVVKSEVPV